jgi:molybdopterin molybdotransferase
VEEAQARILAQVVPLTVETVGLAEAAGRYLAAPLTARRDQPWADLSAMDGYAIRHADLPGPWRLGGESRAGGISPSASLAPGVAMRIFTGAPLPDGADCILVQEEAVGSDDIVTLNGDGPDRPGRNVRPRASDFADGMELIPAGTRIAAPQIAVAAMAGHDRLNVRRRPRIALIATGDELVPVGAPIGRGQIPMSNNLMLAAMLTAEGAEVIDGPPCPDHLDTISQAFRAAVDVGADVIASIGGASVGDYDLVAPAIVQAGGSLDFWKIAMRPGKPLMAGMLNDARVVGLPGNPVSAFVAATLFLIPLVRRLAGAMSPLPPQSVATLDMPLAPGGTRTEYMRATVADGRVVQIADRDSAALLPLACSNALVIRSVGAPAAQAGDRVTFIPIGNGA